MRFFSSSSRRYHLPGGRSVSLLLACHAAARHFATNRSGILSCSRLKASWLLQLLVVLMTKALPCLCGLQGTASGEERHRPLPGPGSSQQPAGRIFCALLSPGKHTVTAAAEVDESSLSQDAEAHTTSRHFFKSVGATLCSPVQSCPAVAVVNWTIELLVSVFLYRVSDMP